MENAEEQTVTVGQIEAAILSLKEKRAAIDEAKAIKSALEKEEQEIEASIMAMLESTGKTSYKGEAGSVSVSIRNSYTLPKDWNSKQALFGYLKEKGLYEEAVTVNSQWLNGFCKREVEAATDAGDLFFEIPGVAPSSSVPILSFRRGK